MGSAGGWDCRKSPASGRGSWKSLAGGISGRSSWNWPVSGRGGREPLAGGASGLGIALIAEWFDVMELPPQYGALLNHQLKATCPTAMAPAQRRWWFFVSRGSVPREQVVAAGGVLRSGEGDWVPAPGTWLEETGRIRWLVQPYLTGWQPYQRRDPIDQIFL